MKISLTTPPNITEIESVFGPACRRRGVLFCFGNTIHNPTGVDIPPQLLAHEEIHSQRQLTEYFTGIPGEEHWPNLPNWSPEKWWYFYLNDPKFRYAEELIAHQGEYKSYAADHNRNQRRLYLKEIADRLSGPLYGYMVTPAKARKEISDGE